MVIRNLNVPEHASVGGEAVLTCDFDLEGGPLFAVKWFKDDQEFLRFYQRDISVSRPTILMESALTWVILHILSVSISYFPRWCECSVMPNWSDRYVCFLLAFLRIDIFSGRPLRVKQGDSDRFGRQIFRQLRLRSGQQCTLLQHYLRWSENAGPTQNGNY